MVYSRGNRLSVVIVFILMGVGVSNSLGLSSLMTCMTMSAIYVNISEVSDKVFEQVDSLHPLLCSFLYIWRRFRYTCYTYCWPSWSLVHCGRAIAKVLATYLGAKVANAEPVIKKYLALLCYPKQV